MCHAPRVKPPWTKVSKLRNVAMKSWWWSTPARAARRKMDFERVQELLENTGLNAEFKQYVRGKNAVEEIEALVESLPASLLVIGMRKRSPVGKLIMGSVAQELLLSVSCPVLAVKSAG
jgi:nucleotide-binding universal stress UspA family protein